MPKPLSDDALGGRSDASAQRCPSHDLDPPSTICATWACCFLRQARLGTRRVHLSMRPLPGGVEGGTPSRSVYRSSRRPWLLLLLVHPLPERRCCSFFGSGWRPSTYGASARSAFAEQFSRDQTADGMAQIRAMGVGNPRHGNPPRAQPAGLIFVAGWLVEAVCGLKLHRQLRLATWGLEGLRTSCSAQMISGA